MWYNPNTGKLSLSQPNITEYQMDEITLEMLEVIIGIDEDYMLVPDKPSEDYYFDNWNWIAKVSEPIVVPKSISPRQARIALLQVGLLDDIEAMLSSDKAMQIWWLVGRWGIL